MAVGGQVEIIGWLYQYYNTEPKDQAFKKKKYLESDIPAVTQLFTPDWIVKYMVDNSLGRYWIDVLKARGDYRSDKEIADDFGWRYFMPAANQTEQVSIQSESTKLSAENIEKVTLIDAAMGSGHILIYAFEVFMQIYEREGYSRRDAAKLIIQKNIYGLDIDTRAFQLAYFSLMMKARGANRRFLTLNIRPNVFDIPESGELSSADFQEFLQSEDEEKQLDYLLDKFRYGNEYGSLVQLAKPVDWSMITRISNQKLSAGQLSLNSIVLVENQDKLREISTVGEILSRQFTIGAMNPPYMGSGKMDSVLGKYVKKHFPNSKSDLFAVFIERLRSLTDRDGYYAMITQHAWMFLSSFKKLRSVLKADTLINMAHLGTRAFEEIGGEVVQSTTFVFKHQTIANYIGTYERLVSFDSQQKKERAYLAAVKNTDVNYLYRTNQANFAKIPGMPIAYWIPKSLTNQFKNNPSVSNISFVGLGMRTGNNSRFLRLWYEIRISSFDPHLTNPDKTFDYVKWVPYDKGGNYRKWYGNNEYVVNWANDGKEIKDDTKRKYPQLGDNLGWKITNENFYFKQGLTWSFISSSNFGVRFSTMGSIFDVAGSSLFSDSNDVLFYLEALLNTKVAFYILQVQNPTLNFQVVNIKNIPLKVKNTETVTMLSSASNSLAKFDWDSFETSWDFTTHPLLIHIADDNLSHCRSPVG
nr:BREX-1 system adenine-specific DNA-methyltransferase PglX [Levilactobacillus huananensis]